MWRGRTIRANEHHWVVYGQKLGKFIKFRVKIGDRHAAIGQISKPVIVMPELDWPDRRSKGSVEYLNCWEWFPELEDD
jgi:hypothetical protein